MYISVQEQNMILNQINKRLNEQYHNYGAFFGLSDPSIWILYMLYESKEKTFTQNNLSTMWFYPKQTVNFTISKLVKMGYARLEQLGFDRNSKAIRLTDKGLQMCEEKIVPLLSAEQCSLLKLTDKERSLLICLNEKQCSYFENEVQKLINENSNK